MKTESLAGKKYNTIIRSTLPGYLLRCILILSVFSPLVSLGQTSYYETDSMLSSGVTLIDAGSFKNSKFCRVKKGDKIVLYTPYEVKEYGFKDGRVYVSKEVQLADTPNKVFLERLHSGKTSLYYFKGKNKKTFFIEKDSTLFIELPKSDSNKERYSKTLLSITSDCPDVSTVSNFVGYNKQSLSRFISRYNECEPRPFPRFRFGILAGYEFAGLIPSDKFSSQYEMELGYEGGFTYGIFADQPILMSDFSLHAEFLYSSHSYSYTKNLHNIDLDFIGSLSSLKMPVLLRYAYPSNTIRPFINTGAVGTYHIKNEPHFYSTLIYPDTHKIEINRDKDIQVSDFFIGYCFGGGFEIRLTRRNSLFIELRYYDQYNLEDSDISRISGYKLLTGINF